MQEPAAANSPRSFQFSLQTLMLVVAYCALVCAWLRTFGAPWGWRTYHPGWLGLGAVGILIAAAAKLRRSSAASGFWGLIILAWLTTLVNVAHRTMDLFEFFGASTFQTFPEAVQQCILWHVHATVSLPLLLTVPLLYVACTRRHLRPTRVEVLCLALLLVPIIDVTVFVLFVWCSVPIWL
jgi:hypothetical protein